jgi:hypothetical protein
LAGFKAARHRPFALRAGALILHRSRLSGLDQFIKSAGQGDAEPGLLRRGRGGDSLVVLISIAVHHVKRERNPIAGRRPAS